MRPARPRPPLTRKRAIDRLSIPSGDTVVWDRDLPSFGIRVHASGRKAWCIQTRGPTGRTTRKTLGSYREITPVEARQKATIAIDRIKRGLLPDPPAEMPEPTVADLAERYMEFHVKVTCKPATIENYRRALRLQILPELGDLRISEVDHSCVSALHYKLRDRPSQANRVVDVLSRMLRLTEAWGMSPSRRNPCRSVRRYREAPGTVFFPLTNTGGWGVRWTWRREMAWFHWPGFTRSVSCF